MSDASAWHSTTAPRSAAPISIGQAAPAMTLHALAVLISDSAAEDWTDMRGVMSHAGYGGVLTYKPNLGVALAWGAREDEEFLEPWINVFSGRRSFPYVLDWMWMGMPVFRQELISVDNGRCLLPKPYVGPDGDNVVPTRAMKVGRLIHELLGSLEDFSGYVKRADLTVINEPWPA